MLNRRTFSSLLLGTITAPALAWSQAGRRPVAAYSGVGPAFTHYSIDVEAATLTKQGSVTLPGAAQYAWPHRSGEFLYVVTSAGGSGSSGRHNALAFRVDPAGTLESFGNPIPLRSRPIHNSLDASGKFLLIAYSDPGGLSVHQINDDGSIGEELRHPDALDVGIYPHQIRTTPSNLSAILVTRGNDANASSPETPGALKVFDFDNGQLTNRASIAPGDGLGFGPRHLDFHPTRPWVYVSVERQNKLFAYKLQPDGGLSSEPLFVKDTLVDPSMHGTIAGPIHVHPNGRFVYLTNRAIALPGQETFEGKRVFTRNDSTIAAFAIDQGTGEPNLVQLVDSQGAHPRTFSIDPSGRILVTGSLSPIGVRDGGRIIILPAGLSVFKIGQDGKLDFVRKYDVETGNFTQSWTGMVALQ